MQNSENHSVFDEKIADVEGITYLISKTLESSESYDGKYIKSLDDLYMKRRDAIGGLKKLINSGVSAEDEYLSKRIDKLIETDKINLDLLNKKVDEIRTKLRKLDKQKSVLIYTRDK